MKATTRQINQIPELANGTPIPDARVALATYLHCLAYLVAETGVLVPDEESPLTRIEIYRYTFKEGDDAGYPEADFAPTFTRDQMSVNGASYKYFPDEQTGIPCPRPNLKRPIAGNLIVLKVTPIDAPVPAPSMPDVDPIFGLEPGAQGGLMHYADNPDNRPQRP